MLCTTRRVSSTCSGALTSDMALATLEKTIIDTAASEFYVKYSPVAVFVFGLH